jgi:hypothetical protein
VTESGTAAAAAAAAAGAPAAEPGASVDGREGSSSSSKSKVLPGHSLALYGCSSFCKTKLDSWSSNATASCGYTSWCLQVRHSDYSVLLRTADACRHTSLRWGAAE